MAYLTMDQTPVSTGTVTLPQTGRLVADLHLAATSAPPGRDTPVTLTFQGGQTYRCAVERANPQGGFHMVRLVGGTGGLSKDIPEKFYAGVEKKQVLLDILSECGETAGDVQLPGTLTFWVRPAGPAHEALRALLALTPERVWRMQPDGRVWVGVEQWPDHARAAQVDTEDAARGVFLCLPDPALTPGVRVSLRRGEQEIVKRAVRVVHQLRGGGSIRVEVHTGDGVDQGPAGFDRAVRQAMRHTDYHALLPGTLLRDHGDHTCDVQVLAAGWPQLVRVPLLVRLPGVKVKVKAGSAVTVAFAQGNPSQPYIECQDTALLERFELTTPRGQRVTLDDDRGQVSPEDAIYKRPYLRVQDEAGQQVELWAEKDKEHVLLTDKAGQTILLDATKGAERVRMQDRAGQEILLRATTGQEQVSVTDKAGTRLLMDGLGNLNLTAAQQITVTAGVRVRLDAPSVQLAGGHAIARMGDPVSVDPNTHQGLITAGSDIVQGG